MTPFVLVTLGNPGHCPVCEHWARRMWILATAANGQRVICCDDCVRPPEDDA